MKSLNKDICPFCNSRHLYSVTSTSMKCSTCKRKYSLKKLELDFRVLEFFCEDKSALTCKENLGINYKSVKDRYEHFRNLILLHVEKKYNENDSRFSEYDEYYFLPKNKRGKVKHLFEAIGVLGMVYNDLIYTLLMPDQFAHLNNTDFSNKDVNFAYLKEYSKYLNRHKIMHFEKFDSPLIKFWIYLEAKLLKYKGIDHDNFIYYLKECEFKFNYPKDEQTEIIWDLWIENKP